MAILTIYVYNHLILIHTSNRTYLYVCLAFFFSFFSSGKHFVTASYVSDDMRKLHTAAVSKGVVLLNEVGLDPGIDHMVSWYRIATSRHIMSRRNPSHNITSCHVASRHITLHRVALRQITSYYVESHHGT